MLPLKVHFQGKHRLPPGSSLPRKEEAECLHDEIGVNEDKKERT